MIGSSRKHGKIATSEKTYTDLQLAGKQKLRNLEANPGEAYQILCCLLNTAIAIPVWMIINSAIRFVQEI